MWMVLHNAIPVVDNLIERGVRVDVFANDARLRERVWITCYLDVRILD